MSLFARVTSDGEPGSPEKIKVHLFGVALREVARGERTLGQVGNAFNLSVPEQNELSAIAATYTALSTDFDKLNFLIELEDLFIAAEQGFYDEATIKTRLGF